MQRELLRLASFGSYGGDAGAWPSALARAGFYYEKTTNEVLCFSCSGRIRHLEGTENAFEEHRRLHPQCLFFLGKDTRNVPLEPPNGKEPLLEPPLSMWKTNSAISASDATTCAHNTRSDLASLAAAPINPHTLSEQDRTALMKREKARLVTFIHWPRDNPIQPQYLAAAGFYFVGPYDRVKCAFCQNVLRNWVAGDDPMTEHGQYYPECPFVAGVGDNGQKVGNVPAENDTELTDAATKALAQVSTAVQQASILGITTDRPRHPEYAIELNRLKTFTGYPQQSPVTPSVLAKAGFFYTGTGDCVRCFFCDMGLRHWEAGDEPWEEHARWYPRCDYVISVKGEAFIQQVQKKFSRASSSAAAAVAPVYQQEARGASSNKNTRLFCVAGAADWHYCHQDNTRDGLLKNPGVCRTGEKACLT